MPDYIHTHSGQFIKKSLTDYETKNLLYKLLDSPGALTSQQLLRKMKMLSTRPENRSEKYIFERLKQLYPDEFEFNKRTHLFNFKKFINDFTLDKNYVRATIIKFKHLFGLDDWEIENEDKKGNRKSEINCIIVTNINTEYNNSSDSSDELNSSGNPDYSVIYYTSDNQIRIVNEDNHKMIEIRWPFLSEDDYKTGFVRYFLTYDTCKLEHQIICKYDLNNDVHFYVKRINDDYSVKYLDIILKDNLKINDPLIKELYKKHSYKKTVTSIVTEMTKDLLQQHRIQASYLNEIKNKIDTIFYNSRNWKYEINLNGFLLYLFLENKEISVIKQKEVNTKRYNDENDNDKEIGKKNKKELKSIKKKISGLLSNEKIIRMCPFLLYNQDFKELVGLDPVETLLNIAHELFPEIDYYEHRKKHSWQNHLSFVRDLDHDSDTFVFHTQIQSEEENRYFVWNTSKRYFNEVEKHFLAMNIDELNLMHFDKKTKEYREQKLLKRLNKKQKLSEDKKQKLSEDKKQKLSEDKKLELGFNSSEIKEYQNLYSKVLNYRLEMCNIIRNLLIYEKKRLIENYSTWYKKYLILIKNNKHYEQFVEPVEFKRLIDL